MENFIFFISKDESLDENLSFGFFFIKIGALESTFIRGFLRLLFKNYRRNYRKKIKAITKSDTIFAFCDKR